MSLSTLVKSTIISGANTVAVALRQNIVHRLQPIEVMKEIRFHDFKKDETKIINLNNELTEDYKIVGVSVDFWGDDNEAVNASLQNSRGDYATCYVRIISKNKASENIILNLSSYPPYVNALYINHNDVWKIKITKDIKKITFRCVPVILDEAKNFA